MPHRVLHQLLPVALLAALVPGVGGCDRAVAPRVSTIEVTARQLVITAPGVPIPLGVIARDGTRALPTGALSYRSLDSSVVRVDAGGVARAWAAGRAPVVVSANGLSDTVTIDVRFDRPVWRFRLECAISRTTAGGMDAAAVQRGFQRLVDSVNARFNAPPAFTGFVHWVPGSVRTFSGDPAPELDSPPASGDFKLVLHTDLSIRTGGYYPSLRVVQLGALAGQAFTEAMGWKLTHELGHARGAPDLYFWYVQGAPDNPVNGEAFAFPPSIMTGDSVRIWDGATRSLVSLSAGNVQVSDSPGWADRWNALGERVGVRVVDAGGAPVRGATVRFHWRGCTSNPYFCGMLPAPRHVAVTDSLGHAQQPPMHLIDGVDIVPLVQLVAVEFAGRTVYAWLTLPDVGLWLLDHPGAPYWREVRLPAGG